MFVLDPAIIDQAARIIVSFIGSPLSIGVFSALDVLQKLAEALPRLASIEESTATCMTRMVRQCIVFLEQASIEDSDRSAKTLQALCTVFRYCGISSLENGDEILISFLEKSIIESKNPHTELYQINQIMDSEHYAFAIVAVVSLREDGSAIEKMIPILQELLEGQSMQVTKFAFEVITRLILLKPEIIPDEIKGQMLEMSRTFVESGHTESWLFLHLSSLETFAT